MLIRYLKKHQLFSIYCVCFLMVAIIPLLIFSAIIYTTTYNNLRDQIIDKEITNLKNTEINLISTYNNYSNLAARLARNYLDYSMFSYTSRDVDYDLFHQFSEIQKNITSLYPAVSSTYAYNQKNGRFLVNNAYYDLDAFPDTQWKDALKSSDIRQYQWIFNRQENQDTLVYPYNDAVRIIINIDVSNMYSELFKNISDKVFVTENDRIIWKNNTQSPDAKALDEKYITLDQEKYFVIKHPTPQNGRTLVVLKNSQEILAPLNSVFTILLIVSMLLLLLIVLASFFMANKLAMPIKNMVSSIDYETELSNELDIISEYIRSLNQTNSTLQSRLSLNSSSTLETNILRLLRNLPLEDGDCASIFPSHIQSYTLATFQFEKGTAAQTVQNYIARLKNVLADFAESLNYYLFSIDSCNLVTLLFSDSDEQTHDRNIHRFASQLAKLDGCRPVVAVSAAVHDPQELHNAFTGNFELIKYRLYADDYILFNTADYAFSDRIDVADYEAAFFSAISSQSYTKASQALSDIIRYIKENRPHPDIVLAYFSLLNIRLRNIPISYGFSNEELLFRNVYETSISSAFNLEDYYRYFLDYANNIIAGLNIKTTSKNNELIASIQAYIVENIENDISLSSVSEHYGMTPQYLSMLFKQETQQNFVKFLTQAKIDRSKELLANTAWPVKKIAEHIGYNERSFFTVFKKHTGMTPKEYRTDAHNRGGGEPSNE